MKPHKTIIYGEDSESQCLNEFLAYKQPLGDRQVNYQFFSKVTEKQHLNKEFGYFIFFSEKWNVGFMTSSRVKSSFMYKQSTFL